MNDYCRNISQGIYFNLDGILNEVLNWNDSKIAYKFVELIYKNIEDTIFGDKDFMEIEDLMYTTLFIYYEIFKQNEDKIDFTITEEHYFKYYDVGMTSNQYRQYISKLKNCTSNSYIDYHNDLVKEVVDLNKVRNIDDKNRQILADILKTFYGPEFIVILYYIWQKLNVLWLDKELHNEILKLSDLAMENAWVIE